MAEKQQVLAAEGLFTWPSDSPQLIGGRCKSCGTYYFPKTYVLHKPGCKDLMATEEVLYSRRGKLDSYTIQYYPSPPPSPTADPYVPVPIGWVSLPEGIAIPGILTGCEPGDIKMHMDVELVVEKACVDEGGNDVLTWKWKKV